MIHIDSRGLAAAYSLAGEMQQDPATRTAIFKLITTYLIEVARPTGAEMPDLKPLRTAHAFLENHHVDGNAIAKAVAEIIDLRRQNDAMRAVIANSKIDCLYCSLPATEIEKCAHGFPGCGRADDAGLCPHIEFGLDAVNRLNSLTFGVTTAITDSGDARGPKPGEIWRHYRSDQLYLVLDIVRLEEHNCPAVRYTQVSGNGEVWVRSVEDWFALVFLNNGSPTMRFMRVESEPF